MARGHNRERQVRRHLDEEGWWTCRAAGSLGDADIVAAKPALEGAHLRLVEVKSTAQGPWEHFRPADRQALSEAARKAGGEAWLAWWPARRKLVWYAEESWPKGNP